MEVDTPDGVVAISDAFFVYENVEGEDWHPLGLNESFEETFRDERARPRGPPTTSSRSTTTGSSSATRAGSSRRPPETASREPPAVNLDDIARLVEVHEPALSPDGRRSRSCSRRSTRRERAAPAPGRASMSTGRRGGGRSPRAGQARVAALVARRHAPRLPDRPAPKHDKAQLGGAIGRQGVPRRRCGSPPSRPASRARRGPPTASGCCSSRRAPTAPATRSRRRDRRAEAGHPGPRPSATRWRARATSASASRGAHLGGRCRGRRRATPAHRRPVRRSRRAWSPDGALDRVRVRPLAGRRPPLRRRGDPRRRCGVRGAPRRLTPEGRTAPLPVWSPDGKRIAYLRAETPAPRRRPPRPAVGRRRRQRRGDAAGPPTSTAASGTGPAATRTPSRPAWAPDGALDPPDRGRRRAPRSSHASRPAASSG